MLYLLDKYSKLKVANKLKYPNSNILTCKNIHLIKNLMYNYDIE